MDLGGAFLDQAPAYSVQTQLDLLFSALDGHKAHTGAGNGFADGLGIIAIVLPPLR